MRVCLEPGCPTLTDRTRCTVHERAKDKTRGKTAERGYGGSHQSERARIQGRIDDGQEVRCVTCNVRLLGTMWDLGHDASRVRWIGPQCVPCNRGHRDAR